MGDGTKRVAAPEPVLEVEGLSHRLYDLERRQEFVVRVPQRLAFHPGTFVSIQGPNACGKTTLLSVFGLLRRPNPVEPIKRFVMRVPEADSVRTLDIPTEWKSERRIEELRRRHLGFALQSGELLLELTVRENIATPLRLNGFGAKEWRHRVDELLSGFDLLKGSTISNLPEARVNTISGGEYQRVALARAIAHRPTLLFVDEPTASLNRQTARQALSQLRQLQHDTGGRTVVVMITHDEALATEYADLIVRLEAASPTAGQVSSITPNTPRAEARSGGTPG